MTKRRLRLLALGVLGGLLPVLATSPSFPSFLHGVRVQRALSIGKSAGTSTERSAAYEWLLREAESDLIEDLVEFPRGRITIVTGDYIRSVAPGAPPRPISVSPAVADLPNPGVGGNISYAWATACERDAATAARTARVLVALMRRCRLDPVQCFVRTLRDPDPGFRRVAHGWLVEEESFPADYDWRSPTLDQEVVKALFHRVDPEHAAARRDRFVEEWLSKWLGRRG